MADIDDIFNEFARAFAGLVQSNRDIAFPETLRREQLDGSVDSLRHVDDYLKHVHRKRKRLSEDEWNTTVLWCGAYVGEVIRHAREGQFRWIDYNDYIKVHPEVKPLISDRTVATCGLLLGPADHMSMPLNKVARFIQDGPENSVHFFAQCELTSRQPDVKEQPKSRRDATKPWWKVW